MMGTEPWSAAERTGQKVLLVDGGQHLGRAALESPVRYGWHPKGALLRLSGLGDINAADVRCLISLPVNGFEHGPDPFLEVLLRPLHRLAIHPSSGMLRNLLEILQHPLTRDVMSQRGEAKIWLTPSFHCYLLKFRCHGRLIFSSHRRPRLPLHGAHVTQEQSNYR